MSRFIEHETLRDKKALKDLKQFDFWIKKLLESILSDKTDIS